MAANAWTQGSPKANNSTRLVLAERVYMAPSSTPIAYSDPAAKLNGTAPTGTWVDLGIVQGSKVTLSYNKEIKYIETGIDKVRRGAYVAGKTAQATFTLEQFDMGVLEAVTGLTKIAVGAIGNKLHIGQDDLIDRSILFVGTNKVDGKELHHYSNKAGVSFSFEDADDSRVLKVTADLYSFTPSGQSVDAFVTLYILD